MRVIVKYFKPMVFGNQMTLSFNDIDPDNTSVWQLKRKVSDRLETRPNNQKMTICNDQCSDEMHNEKLISSYLCDKCDFEEIVVHLTDINE